jgi:hypothetical protein
MKYYEIWKRSKYADNIHFFRTFDSYEEAKNEMNKFRSGEPLDTIQVPRIDNPNEFDTIYIKKYEI